MDLKVPNWWVIKTYIRFRCFYPTISHLPVTTHLSSDHTISETSHHMTSTRWVRLFVALFNEFFRVPSGFLWTWGTWEILPKLRFFDGNWRSSPIISLVCSVCFHIFSMKKLIKTSIYGGDFPWKLIKTSISGWDFPAGHVWWYRVVSPSTLNPSDPTQREPRRGVVNASRRGDPRSQWKFSCFFSCGVCGLYWAKLVWLSRYIYITIIIYIYLITRLDLTTVVGDLNIS